MKKLIGISLLAIYLVALMPAQFAHAQAAVGGASVSFNPPGGTIPKDTNFDVNIVVNTGGQPSAGADVTVKFETSKLEFVSGVYPASTTFYPNTAVISPIAASGGIIGMSRLVSGGATPVYTNGSGTFATLTFKTKSSTAIGDTTSLSFEYTAGATGDFTNVTNSSTPAQDLLGTTTLPTATYTVVAATSTPPPPVVGTDPVITSIAPSSGPSNEIVGVTIYGSNFGASVDGLSKVYLGTKLISPEDVHSWTDTQIFIQVDAEPNLKGDSLRQLKVHRADGKEATYLGYKLIASGPEALVWGGLILTALLMAWFAYRRMNVFVSVNPSYAMPLVGQTLPIMNYQPEAPLAAHRDSGQAVSQITYRNWQ